MYSLTRSLHRAALINRNGIATYFEGNETSWQDTLLRVQRIAAVLLERGVQNNDRVALLGGNSDTFYQCLFAINWAGGISMPLNMRFAVPEIAYCLSDSGSKILLVDEEFLDMVPEISLSAPQLKVVISLGKSRPESAVNGLADLVKDVAPVEDAGRAGKDIAALYYTGGTTGRSKGVMLGHDDFVVNVIQWAHTVGVTSKERNLIIAPMFHLVGGLNSVAAAVLASSLVIARKFDAGHLVQMMVKNEVSKTCLVPIMLDAIVAWLEENPTDLSCLKRISYGGAPMSEKALKRALAALPNTSFYQVYGQTEGGPNISVLDARYHVLDGPDAGKLRSAGQPLPGVEVDILDEEGNPLKQGETGEICVRGLTVSQGYWNLPEETAEANRFGWLHTGDAGYFDEDGFLFIVDRIKDMIITGGLNVYSAEVENIINRHPSVGQCAVIGIPSERWGEQIHAIVRLAEGAKVTEEELAELCRSELAGYKQPRSFEFRVEPFPVTGLGKVLKREIRAPYWEASQPG
ncbi:MAG: AMP-binding protein [Xanthomonadales bacterium]|nr:AMP-binding protein [Xanthomonadales bacterium]